MRSVSRYLGIAILAVGAGMTTGTAASLAAPQALALVATQGSTALICNGTECSAEFSSFCLQAGRTVPARGTSYLPHGNGAIHVAGTTRDGHTIAFIPSDVLRFEALRNHVAVRVSVPQAVLDQYSLTAVSVQVGEAFTLVPQAVDGDPWPQTEDEIAAASGPMRAFGSSVVDTDGERMAAAQLTNRMINALAADPISRGDVADALWDRSVGNDPQLSAEAKDRARGALAMCNFAVERNNFSDVRKCLQQHHDRMMVFLNSRYWTGVGAGM